MKYLGLVIIVIIIGGFIFAQLKFGPFYYAGLYNVLSLSNVEVETDISYATDPRLKLDVYHPAHIKSKKNPVVFFVHGGSWKSNNKDQFKFIGQNLARRGYIAVLPNYRLVPEYRYPAQIKDVAQALHWTEKNINKFGGNTEKIILSGHSAGGHLASLLGYSEKWQQKYNIDKKNLDSLVLLAGVYKFSNKYKNGASVVKDFVPENYWEEAQPALHLDEEVPKTIILHGKKDKVVSIEQARYLHNRLDEFGIKNEMFLEKDMNHVSLLFSFANKKHNLWNNVTERLVKWNSSQ